MNNTELIKNLISNNSEYNYNTLTFLNLLPYIFNKSTMFKDFLEKISSQVINNITFPVLTEGDFAEDSVFDYIQKNIDQDIKAKTLKENNKLFWNESLNKIYNQIDKYSWDQDWQTNDIDTMTIIPFGSQLKTLTNIYESDAGNSFEITQNDVVIPFENIDKKDYLNIRGLDKVQSVLEKDEALDFTEEKKSKFIRLLMPRNIRRVEIEDLNRNFWVIGQVISLISSELFSEEAPLLKPLELLLEEIIQQWQNIIYLWLLSAISAQDQKITLHCEVIDLPIANTLPFRKFDNFDYGIDNLITKDIVKERCKYLISKYPNSNLCILPRIRIGNYMKNYYNMEVYPYILLLNRYKGQKDFQVIQLTYETNFYSNKIPAFHIEGTTENTNGIVYDSSDYSQSIAAIREINDYKIERIARYDYIKDIDVSTQEEPFFGFIRVVPFLSATLSNDGENFDNIKVNFEVYDMANENGAIIKKIQSITTKFLEMVNGEIARIRLERKGPEVIDSTKEIETLLNYVTPAYYGEMISSPVYKNVDNIVRDVKTIIAPYNNKIVEEPIFNETTIVERLEQLQKDPDNTNKNLAVLFYQRVYESKNQENFNTAIYFPAIGFYDINNNNYVCRFLKSNNNQYLHLNATDSDVLQLSYMKVSKGTYCVAYPNIENLEPDQNTLYSSYLQWNGIINAEYKNKTIEITKLSIEIRDQLNTDSSTNLLYKVNNEENYKNNTNNSILLDFEKILDSIDFKLEGDTDIRPESNDYTLVGEQMVLGLNYNYVTKNVQFKPINGLTENDNSYLKKYMKINLSNKVLEDYENKNRTFYIFTGVRYNNNQDYQASPIQYETIGIDDSITIEETNYYGGADRQITSIGIFDPVIYSSRIKASEEQEEALSKALICICPKDDDGNYVKQGFNTRSYACFVEETYDEDTDPFKNIDNFVEQSHTYLYFTDHSQFFSTQHNWRGGEVWDIRQYSRVTGAESYSIKGTYSSYDGYLSNILHNLAEQKIRNNGGTISGYNPNLRGDLYRFYFEYDPSQSNEQDKIKVVSQTREQIINGNKNNCENNLKKAKVEKLSYTLDAYQVEKEMHERSDSTHQEIGFTKLWRNLLWMYMTNVSEDNNVIVDLPAITRQNDNCYVLYTAPFTYQEPNGNYKIDTISIKLRYGYWKNNEFSGYCCKYNENTGFYELAEGTPDNNLTNISLNFSGN